MFSERPTSDALDSAAEYGAPTEPSGEPKFEDHQKRFDAIFGNLGKRVEKAIENEAKLETSEVELAETRQALQQTELEKQREKERNAEARRVIDALHLTVEEQKMMADLRAAELQSAKELATKDPLTELYNRTGFIEQVSRLIPKKHIDIDQEERSNPIKHAPMAIMLLDADYFKKVNDTYGHLAGDLVLKELARKLKSDLRNEDIIARYGGEEIVIALPNTSAEQILKRLGANDTGEPGQFSVAVTLEDGREITVTVSGGVTEYEFENDNETIEAAVDRADQLAYAAKQNGRNQILSEHSLLASRLEQ